ncbi:nuclear transport factor 2 family protein [Streptomyces sp. NPDC004096]
MSDERKVQEVLARYVRSIDKRDGTAQGALFTPDATVQIYSKTGPDSYEPVGDPLIGGDAVRGRSVSGRGAGGGVVSHERWPMSSRGDLARSLPNWPTSCCIRKVMSAMSMSGAAETAR